MLQYSNITDYTWKAILAEFIGTFTLVFVIGAAISVGSIGTTTIVSNAALVGSLGAALALVGLFYTWGWFSGAHLNPAVSIAFWVSGRMSFWLMLAYIVIQLIAGIAAAALLSYVFNFNRSESVGTLTNVDGWKAVLVEAFLTFFLTLTVLFVTANPILASVAGLAIGFIFGALMLSGFSLTGGSMNPARSLGPAIFTNNLGTIWIYIVGPLIGAVVAGLIYRLFKADFACCVKKDECGDAVLDQCGNKILVCNRPVPDCCGNPLKDECGDIVYEQYEKRNIAINHMQQTPLDMASQLAQSRGYSPVYLAYKGEKILSKVADKVEQVLCDDSAVTKAVDYILPTAANALKHSGSHGHEGLKLSHTEFKGKLKISGEHDEVNLPVGVESAIKERLENVVASERGLSNFAPVVQNKGSSILSSFKGTALAPTALSN